MVDLKEIRKLSVQERILMVETIWDRIAEATTPPGLRIPEEEKKEILKRFDEFKKGDQETYSWDEVKIYAQGTLSLNQILTKPKDLQSSENIILRL